MPIHSSVRCRGGDVDLVRGAATTRQRLGRNACGCFCVTRKAKARRTAAVGPQKRPDAETLALWFADAVRPPLRGLPDMEQLEDAGLLSKQKLLAGAYPGT
jgi:hypothetical protein